LFSNSEEGPRRHEFLHRAKQPLSQITSTDMQKPLTPDEVWLQAERRAARRREYGISLHAPFSDKHPALPYMTAEEREAYLSAIEVLAEGKKEQQAPRTGRRRHRTNRHCRSRSAAGKGGGA
jgi:hypothetical protein